MGHLKSRWKEGQGSRGEGGTARESRGMSHWALSGTCQSVDRDGARGDVIIGMDNR